VRAHLMQPFATPSPHSHARCLSIHANLSTAAYVRPVVSLSCWLIAFSSSFSRTLAIESPLNRPD